MFRIAVSPDDSDISRQLRSARWYSDEKFETEVFASFVEPGAHVFYESHVPWLEVNDLLPKKVSPGTSVNN